MTANLKRMGILTFRLLLISLLLSTAGCGSRVGEEAASPERAFNKIILRLEPCGSVKHEAGHPNVNHCYR